MISHFSSSIGKLNTDYLNYTDTLVDGFPQSSPKTRIFKPVGSNYSKNSVIQFPKGYTKEYLEHKLNRHSSPKYHQQLENQATKYYKSISDFIGKYSNKDSMHKIPCDVVVCSKTSNEDNNISLVHLNYPNEWSAGDAIGKPFYYFHKSIKRRDGSSIVPDHHKLIDNFVGSGNFYERVGAYSIRETPHLDMHPDLQQKCSWNPGTEIEDFYLRFERQVVAGLPEIDSFIFLIHTYFVSASAKPSLMKSAIQNRDHYCYPRDVIDTMERELIGCCDRHVLNK